MAKGFKHGAGGGTSLNFKVVGGTTAPSNPKENTIWVDTDTAIHTWDFSATEPHRRSNNKNLIVYPYLWTQTGSQSGITYTVNSDGTISANGTASANAYCHVSNTGIEKGEIILEAGTYTLSGCSGGGSNYALNIAYSHDNWATQLQKKVASGSTTFTIDKPAKARFFININSGTTVSNLAFKPQLEKGSTATSFVKGDATGQVWIPTGTSSAVEFNALKKNGIAVYPIAAKQYVSGAWVDKPVEFHQNSEWTSFEPWLIKGGVEFPYGPWGKLSYTTQTGVSATVSLSPTQGGFYIYVPAQSKSWTKAAFFPKIDVTIYTTLTVKWKAHGTNPTVGFIDALETDNTKNQTYIAAAYMTGYTSSFSPVTTSTIDISNLSGAYIFCISNAGTAYTNTYSGEIVVYEAYLS